MRVGYPTVTEYDADPVAAAASVAVTVNE